MHGRSYIYFLFILLISCSKSAKQKTEPSSWFKFRKGLECGMTIDSFYVHFERHKWYGIKPMSYGVSKEYLGVNAQGDSIFTSTQKRYFTLKGSEQDSTILNAVFSTIFGDFRLTSYWTVKDLVTKNNKAIEEMNTIKNCSSNVRMEVEKKLKFAALEGENPLPWSEIRNSIKCGMSRDSFFDLWRRSYWRSATPDCYSTSIKEVTTSEGGKNRRVNYNYRGIRGGDKDSVIVFAIFSTINSPDISDGLKIEELMEDRYELIKFWVTKEQSDNPMELFLKLMHTKSLCDE